MSRGLQTMSPERLEFNGMMHEISRLRPALLLFLAPLLGSVTSPPPAQQSLAFEPAPGTQRTKSIERREEFSLDELEIAIDGRDLSSAFRALDFAVDNHLQLRVRDEYKQVVDGRIEALERSFEELQLASTQSLFARSSTGEPARIEGKSPFEKRRLGLFREASGGAPRVEVVDGGAPLDPALTAGLRMELDATGFLPKVPVVPRDRWKVDPALVGPLFAPCGELHFSSDGATPSPLVLLGAGPDDRYTGEISATFEGVVANLGKRVARISIEVNLTATRELDADDAALRPDFPAPVELETTRHELRTRFEGTGLLEWNLDANVLETFEVTGEGGVSILLKGTLKTGALEQVLHQELGLVGPQALSITCRN